MYDINAPFSQSHCDCGVCPIIVDGYMMVCPECGVSDMDKNLMCLPCNHYSSFRKWTPYKRKTYFKELLDNICCRYVCCEKEYSAMIVSLGQYEFSNTRELKQLMKRKGYNKYYKYLFAVYRDITGTTLISIGFQLYAQLLDEFHRFDLWYKRRYGKRNLVNYNVLLYSLLKHYGVANYDSILLPQNYRKSSEIIEKYWEVVRE